MLTVYLLLCTSQLTNKAWSVPSPVVYCPAKGVNTGDPPPLLDTTRLPFWQPLFAMIVIHVELANASLVSLFVALLCVTSAVLGLVLGVHEYSALRRVQIPACFTGAAEICAALSHFSGVVWPYKLVQVTVNVVTTALLVTSGLYYICERVTYSMDMEAHHFNIPLERAFLCLWLLSLAFSATITAFSVGASWLATVSPASAEDEVSDSEKMGIVHDHQMETEGKLFSFKKVGRKRSVYSLGSPVDIPTVPTLPDAHSPLSPQLSWPSTMGSIRNHRSLDSLRSALDMNTGSTNAPHHQNQHTHKDSTTAPHDSRPPHNGNGNAHNSNNKTPSPMKTPKSPLKIHLSRSSFSLRRSPSKASQLQQNTKRSIPENKSVSQLPPMASEQHALGIPLGILPDHNAQKSWVMIPNENVAESRSVSGSSQVTGNLFPASEYNRKLNAAGFQRDEPVPVNVQMVPSLESLSRYDLERLHKRQRQEHR